MTEANQERFDELKSRLEDLQESFDPDDMRRRLERTAKTAQELPERLATLRERGYPFSPELDTQATTLNATWGAVRKKVAGAIDEEHNGLTGARSMPGPLLTQAERLVENEAMFDKLADQVEAALDRLETANNEASKRIDAIANEIEDQINDLSSQLRAIEKVMDYAEDITFKLADGERVYMAAEAELIVTGKGGQDPDGVVFLTNQRVVFEQREKTGKRMGMFGGKMEQEVEWETPLSAVSVVNTENKGVFKGRDMLHITHDGANATLELKGRADNNQWAEAIQKMIDGEIQ